MFKYLIEGRRVLIRTDHKPLIYAFAQKPEKVSPCQLRQLDLISQLSTEIVHIAGTENTVANAFSRLNEVRMPTVVTSQQLRDAQETDLELLELLQANTSLKLQRLSVDTEGFLYYDVTTGTIRPYVPKPLRRQIFLAVHNCSHPSGRTTCKLVRQRFVLPAMRKHILDWARTCIPCQRAKIQRHTRNEPQKIPMPENCFDHIHIDFVGPLSPAGKYRHLFTMINWFTHLSEAVPLENVTAETVATAFFTHWIARFGSPRTITSDQGPQFEAVIFKALAQLGGGNKTRTTVYHPASIGLAERWHRSLKTAHTCHGTSLTWVEFLPALLLGLRSCFKEDLKCSVAELVYRATLRIPG